MVDYPEEFHAMPHSPAEVQNVVAAKYPGNPADLDALCPDGDFFVEPYTIPKGFRTKYHPPFLGLRSTTGLNRHRQDFMLRKFDRLKAMGLPHLLGDEPQRSGPGSRAWHFGVWSIYAKKPRITAESRSQCKESQECVDKFMAGAQKFVVPLVTALLRRYAPVLWARHQR
jgi:hypothetical protein